MISNNPFSLVGKTILVSGASSGIGQAIALGCAQQGAKVLLLGRNMERLKETLERCGKGTGHKLLALDFQGTLGWKEELVKFVKENAPIHGFVHAAGISPTIPLKVLRREQIQDTFELNVVSAIEISQIVTKLGVRSSEGMSMVMISSVMSEVGEKGKSLYAMTKAALVALVKSLALEYADRNIRFNAISPSVVNTPLSEKSQYRRDASSMKQVLDKHPLGLGEAEDVANAALYLLSDASKWVTGTNMVVDGGYLSS